MIALKNVTKVMDNNVILDNINLNLEEGKIYGLVGAMAPVRVFY